MQSFCSQLITNKEQITTKQNKVNMNRRKWKMKSNTRIEQEKNDTITYYDISWSNTTKKKRKITIKQMWKYNIRLNFLPWDPKSKVQRGSSNSRLPMKPNFDTILKSKRDSKKRKTNLLLNLNSFNKRK